MTTSPDRGNTHHPPPPADHGELASFPTRDVNGVWFRSHVDYGTDRATGGGVDRGCWWFSSVTGEPAKSGRFDLPPTRGTCYLGVTEEIAARERVGTQLKKRAGQESVSSTALVDDDGNKVLVTQAPVDVSGLANMPVKAAQRWVNRSLWTGTGIYDISQQWAAAFDAAGFPGLIYEPRFTGGATARALALFGEEMRPVPAMETGTSRNLDEVLKDAGVRIVSPPESATAILPAGELPPAL